MGGVDQSDMMLYAYLNERRTVKYWKKVAFRTVNSMFVNAYIINKQNTNATRPLTKYQLYVQAVESLVDDYLESAAARNDTNEKPGIKDMDNNKENDCSLCSDRKQPGGRERSRTECTKCHLGLHGTCIARHKCKN
ncbi:hypothetical protein RRG08_002573 [Elysia crispata]|uniref:PiggyBac transposable element-derived protein domain-containing protein n=1 Tax=Elysia crispata TaxID=231223 RepID=A0AAE0Y670_9GAST|nr:hypothetical protein RRG08_002573 [Elysia crispata]